MLFERSFFVYYTESAAPSCTPVKQMKRWLAYSNSWTQKSHLRIHSRSGVVSGRKYAGKAWRRANNKTVVTKVCSSGTSAEPSFHHRATMNSSSGRFHQSCRRTQTSPGASWPRQPKPDLSGVSASRSPGQGCSEQIVPVPTSPQFGWRRPRSWSPGISPRVPLTWRHRRRQVHGHRRNKRGGLQSFNEQEPHTTK